LIKTISQFIKNIGFNMIADLSVKLSKSLLLILISNALGVSSMGAFSIALTYIGFGILLSNWGFGNLLTREVSRENSNYSIYLSNFIILRITFAIIATIIINIVISFFSYNHETISVIRIISLSLIATTIIKLIYSLFIAFEDLKPISIVFFITSTIRLLISLVVVFLGGTIIQISVYYTIVEYLTMILCGIITIKRLSNFQFHFDYKFALSQISIAFPFFWIGISAMLDTRVEILILSFYFNEAIVGYYTAVNTILGGVTLFSEAIRNAVFPIVTRYQKDSSVILKKTVHLLGKYILLITVPISILIFFFADEIIFFLFRDNFHISVTMLRITIWIFIFYSYSVVLSNLLMAHNKERVLALFLLFSGLLTVLLNLLVAPIIGVIGIAIVRLITSVIMFVLPLYFHKKETGYGIVSLSTVLRILLCGFAMFIIIHFLSPYNLWFSSLLAVIIYIVGLFILKVTLLDDISLLKKVMSNLVKRDT